MALDVNDLAEDKTFFKRKFCYVENHGEPKNYSVGFLKEKLKEQQIFLMEHPDSDYLNYLEGSCMSIPDDLIEHADSDYLNHLKGSCMSIPNDVQDALIVKGVGCHTQHELAVDGFSYDPEHQLPIEDVGDDPQHQLPVEDVSEDPQYALFLSRLKECGSSYILEADDTLGLTKPLIYEEDESADKGQEDLDNSVVIQWRESKTDHDLASFYASLRSQGSKVVYSLDGNSSPAAYHGLDLPNLQTDSGSSSRKRKSKLPICKEKSNDISEEDTTDFLFWTETPAVTKFRVQIMSFLSKPYDKGEHEKLKQEITMQKPQVRHIDLRSKRVLFSASNKKGKSYLDHHVDLKRKIQAAEKDERKQLNLLRGFFFWIQNPTQEGSFIPWNDEECLAVQPQSC